MGTVLPTLANRNFTPSLMVNVREFSHRTRPTAAPHRVLVVTSGAQWRMVAS
jgi:hypothetical protein